MSNDWDFYSCRVDDKPASIFVDLGIRRDVPLSGRPYMAFVRLFMRAPRHHIGGDVRGAIPQPPSSQPGTLTD